MSKKGKNIDVLGEAFLPDDLLKPTLGENYGLDGYPDMEYGLGVLEGFVPDDTSGLPEGLTAEEEAEEMASIFADEGSDVGMDLTGMVREGGLSDLSWLELNEQDPDRLPENPVNLSIPELEEAWGTERRTDGLHFRANVDPDVARYRASLEETGPQYKHEAADLARVVRKAMRRSAVGHPLKEILREAAEALSDEAHRIRGAMQIVKGEHGLAGNVFIRAAAYPGLHTGTDWSEALRKASGARYILVDEKTLTGSVNVQDGHCTVTKKRAVTEIPWDEALAHYRPVLEATGRKVAGGNPRDALRAAFLSRPVRTPRATAFPTHVAPSQRVSSEEARRKLGQVSTERKVFDRGAEHLLRGIRAAWERMGVWMDAGLISQEIAADIALAENSGPDMLRKAAAHILRSKGASAFSGLPNDVRPPEVTMEAAKAAMAEVRPPAPIDISHRPEEAARKRALRVLARWVRDDLLSEADARRLAAARAPAFDTLRAAGRLVASPKVASDYSGVSNDARPQEATSREQVFTSLEASAKASREAQAKVDATVRERRQASTVAARRAKEADARIAKIIEAVEKGVRGKTLQSLIARTIPAEERKYAVKKLASVLRDTGALEGSSGNARTYDGRAYRPVPQRIASIPQPNVREAEALVRWVRRAMNEGAAGRDLDELIEARFSATVREAAREKLAAVRGEHEGGAGFVYVDSATYASKTGTSGCEKGALKHRANQLKFVLAMDRCASCALRGKLADGTVRCRKYNKDLVTASELPDEIGLLRRANIRASGMTDAEATASLFAPSFDPGEFGLRNAEFDDLEIDASPEVEELGEILFGGVEF